jgi:hypothetical protein
MQEPDKSILPAGTITAYCSEDQISYETSVQIITADTR